MRVGVGRQSSIASSALQLFKNSGSLASCLQASTGTTLPSNSSQSAQLPVTRPASTTRSAFAQKFELLIVPSQSFRSVGSRSPNTARLNPAESASRSPSIVPRVSVVLNTRVGSSSHAGSRKFVTPEPYTRSDPHRITSA